MADQKERRYRRVGLISSIAIQLVLVLLFYFLIAWKERFPDRPSYGIELSFGMVETGAGNEPVSNPQPAVEETASAEAIEEETVEEAVEEMAEQPETTEMPETPLTDTPSPDGRETEMEEEKVETPEEREEKPALNPAALMPSANEDSDVNETKGTTASEGNEGRKEGAVDGRALMGERETPGASLSLAGWKWVSPPDPKDDSDESGRIQFQIKIDENGDLIEVKLMSIGISPDVVQRYRQAVEKLQFYKTSNQQSATVSSGTITFIIRAK